MKRIANNQRGLVIAVAIAALSFGLLSWEKKQSGSVYIDQKTDTIPASRDRKVRDLDDVLKELEDVQFNLQNDLKIDMDRMKKELEQTFKEFDANKLKLELEKSFDAVDFEKMKLDMDKMKLDLEKTFKELDFNKFHKDFEESFSKVDFDKLKLELENVKKIDFSALEKEMKQLEVEMGKIGPEIEQSLAKAKVEIEKAREEMKEYNAFINTLEKDGLLKRTEGYSLKHKDGEFFINGKKQSADVYNKYKYFLDKHKSFNIERTDDDFDMDIDD